MSPKGEAYPHEKRVQKYGYLALAAAALTGMTLAAMGDGELRGIEPPRWLPFALLALGAIVGAFAIARRSDVLVAIGAGVLVLGVLPGGAPRPGLATYAIGLLFGVAILALVELVHMTERYERAHRAVDNENVPEEHINRVTDESLRTLATRAGAAALCVAGAVLLAFALSVVGPLQWRAAVETSAPLGVAVVGLALAGAVSLFILAHGATFRLRRETPDKELLPDVAE